VQARIVVGDDSGRTRSFRVEWAGPATLHQLLTAAGMQLRHRDAAVSVDGVVHGGSATLDFVGLRDASVVSIAPHRFPSTPAADIASHLHLAIIAGPAAGTMVPLPRGALCVGADPAICDLVLVGHGTAPRHLAVEHGPDGSLTIEALAPGVTLDGASLSGRRLLIPGQEIALTGAVATVRVGRAPDAVVEPVENRYEIHRPPRLRPPVGEVVVELPAEPPPPVRQPIPWAASAIPIVMGVALYLFTGSALMLLFVALSPMMAAVNVVTSRRTGKIHHRHALAVYQEAKAEAEQALAASLDRERRDRLIAAPDAATIAATARGPRRELWERRRHHGDFLQVRLGLATLPATVRTVSAADHDHIPAAPTTLDGVPAVVSLAEVGVLGVTGPPSLAGAMACWLVAQVAVTSGPADVQIVVLTGPTVEHERRWGWARWLPHTLAPLPGGPPRFGTTVETAQARIAELVATIDERRGADRSGRADPRRTTDWPHVLVVLDPAYDLRRLPGVDLVLGYGPSVGVHAICVDQTDSYLPTECGAVLSLTSSGTADLAVAERPTLEGILADEVTTPWLAALGRSLAPARDPETVSPTGTVPTRARLVELLGLARLDATTVLDGWARSGRSTSATVGVTANGPMELDLRTDGPHALVAGTTGAGKSELLQTLITALAVVNRPDSMTFLLVDYKGGSAFRDCARLPHTVGVMTDLDHRLTVRALVSLTAELKRREELLARGGAKDIDDYMAMGAPSGALPRLVIVIDEFAGLVAELPEFVSGLVGIAQRGRSLGIHLVLATQRPSGVVSPEIRANTNLRIALRVTSAVESADVIDAPDAARIMPGTPGRAYVRTGHSALSLFQTARVAGPATPAATDQGPEIAVTDDGWSRAGEAPRQAAIESGSVDPTDTDLARLATILREAADRLGIAPQEQPWLPPLPALVRAGDLQRSEPGPDGVSAAPFALIDLPLRQRQETLTYHPGRDRHLAVVGGPGSGRTTLLRTLAMGLAGANSPEDLWLFAIDCGGGELRRLAQLPHSGAVVTRTEVDRVSRLLTRLHGELHRRLDQLASEGYADVAEQRASASRPDRLPYIVVLVDRWEGFTTVFDAIDNQRLTDLVVDLAREGGSAGICLVVAGDRSLLSGRLCAAIEDRLCLSLPDRNDYAFAGLDVRDVPDPMGPGRAVRCPDSAELQIAVAGSDAGGPGQVAAVTALVDAWRTRSDTATGTAPGARPFRVDPLPTELGVHDALAYPRAPGSGDPTPHTALLGVGGDELHAVSVDVLASGGFVVAGPRHSGRSNTLVVMAGSLLTNGCAVLALCPRPSPLACLRDRPGVIGVFSGDDPPVKQVLEAVNAVEGPLVVIVDDATVVHGAPVAELLAHVSIDGPSQGHALIVAGIAEELARPMRGFIYHTVQSRTGLLLCPEHTTDGELLGTRLLKSAVFRQPAGRGVLVDGLVPEIVQVPRATG